MKKKKGLSVEEIRAFAAALRDGAESEASETARAILEEAAADGKAFADKAGQAPEIVPFLLDHGAIPRDRITDYCLTVSWLEHRDLILQLKAYERGERRTGESGPAAPAPVRPGKTPAQLKAEWRTEKCKDGTLRLLAYRGTDEAVEVPEKIGGDAVTEIGPFAFSPLMPRLKAEQKAARERIREIRMGEGIRGLGGSCFEACAGLERVVLPAGLKTVPERAFADCAALERIELPEGLTTVGSRAFFGCTKLEELRLPDSAAVFETEKGAWSWEPAVSAAFAQCKSLKTIRLPAGLKVLPAQMFAECSALESVALPEGLEEIGDEAFASCKALKTLVLPEGLKRLGGQVLKYAGLKQLRLPAALEHMGSFGLSNALLNSAVERLILPFGTLRRFRELYLEDNLIDSVREYVLDTEESELTVRDGAIYTADMKTLVKVPAVCGKSFSVPEGVEEIGHAAFLYCKAGTILLPNSVRHLGEYCFWRSDAERIFLPDTVTEIPDGTFSNCKELKEADLPAGITSIGTFCFNECLSLKRVVVPGGVKAIGKNAFSDCIKLKEAVLEDGVEEIGESAFCRCDALERVVIPGSVKKIGKEAFRDCGKLKEAGPADGVEEIGKDAFRGCRRLGKT